MSSEINFFGFPAHVAVNSADAATNAETYRDVRSSYAVPEARQRDRGVIGKGVREIIRAPFSPSALSLDADDKSALIAFPKML